MRSDLISTKVIRVGVAGLGRSGWNLHVTSLQHDARYQIVAVCDVNEGRLAQAKTELGVSTFTDFRVFLEEVDPELVVVASPTVDHAWMVRYALESGCHVVVEKPLTAKVSQAESLQLLAIKQNCLLFPYYNFRFAEDYLWIKDFLSQDRIGRPFLIKKHVGYFNRRDDWQSFNVEAGGILGAATIHHVDQMIQLAGAQPIEIWKDVRRLVSKGDAPDHSKIVMRFPDGLVADVEVSWAESIGGTDWSIYGPRGAVRGEGGNFLIRWFDEDKVTMALAPDRSYLSGEKISWKEETQSSGVGFSNGYYDALVSAIRNDQQPPVTWESAIESFKVLERCGFKGITTHGAEPEVKP